MKIAIGYKRKKDLPRSFSVRTLLAMLVVVGLTYFVYEFSEGFYYKPICKRYADSRQLTYDGYTTGWAKKGWPAKCFFRDKNGNSKGIEIATLPLTSGDWVRWLLSCVAVIAGLGGLVLLASVIGGFKPRRRRRKR